MTLYEALEAVRAAGARYADEERRQEAAEWENPDALWEVRTELLAAEREVELVVVDIVRRRLTP